MATESVINDTCFKCGAKLELVNGAQPPQFDNALTIKFTGGYGMFVDDFLGNQYEATLCHECAHEFCQQVPWIFALIDPYHSHSHTRTKDWTGHFGWDLPHEHV